LVANERVFAQPLSERLGFYFRDIRLDKAKRYPFLKLSQVRFLVTPGIKVYETIDAQDLVAASEKGFGYPGPDKTRATCDKYLHAQTALL
jgi:hypothetical protein